ncbi:MAG: DUF481 domain-containing protein [Acidobacteria bacterium]|nr:DUF481 domain-containing protein [Acidobacteriota bacterium]
MSRFFLVLACASAMLLAQESANSNWSDQAELSIINSGGNSEAFTFGLANNFAYKWDGYEFSLKFGANKVESTKTTRTAVGSLEDYEINEDSVTETTQDKYYFSAAAQKKYSERLHGFVGIDWDRNEPAGIKNRYAASVGITNQWRDTDTRKFRTSYGLQYTDETPVDEPPNFDGAYAGLRFELNHFHGFTERTKFANDWVSVFNLEEGEDWRSDMKLAVISNLSDKMALKIGLNLIYDNQPAFKKIPLLTDGSPSGTVLYELDELDYVFTTSIVLNF